MAEPPLNSDAVYPGDYDHFILNLREIIEDAPAGYQAKFARLIAILNQKKLSKIEEIRAILESGGRDPAEINYERLLQSLSRAFEDPSIAGEERYGTALKIAKLREEKLLEKGQESSGEPPGTL